MNELIVRSLFHYNTKEKIRGYVAYQNSKDFMIWAKDNLDRGDYLKLINILNEFKSLQGLVDDYKKEEYDAAHSRPITQPQNKYQD